MSVDPKLVEKARELLNRHLVTTTLSTTDKEGNVDCAILNSAAMHEDNLIVAARMSLKRSYESLKQTGKGVFTIIVPGETPEQTDGVRIYVRLVGDETHGAAFDELKRWVLRHFGDFPVQNRLVFEITETRPLWER